MFALCHLGALGAALGLAAAALAAPGEDAVPEITPGTTRIARWKDDKQAAFMLLFDDSCLSHVKHVVPELRKRGLVGTFYVNPASGHWKAMASAWEKEIPAAGMEYGNHTMTHKGVRDLADAEEEISGCSQVILRLFPGPQPRLLSWGQPGVKKEAWNITPEQLKELLAKHHLVNRPTFEGHGGAIHHKTAADMQRLLDRALDKGTCEYLIFHGVGGDWISVALPEFTGFLDALVAVRDRVWVARHIPIHQYETERDSAAVRLLEATGQQIRLELTCQADPKLYDLPLTLVTQVPAEWQGCRVAQGSVAHVVAAAKGTVRYDAKLGGLPVVLQRAAPPPAKGKEQP